MLLPLLEKKSDVSALMVTCKALYDFGIKPLLSYGVRTATDAQLLSLYRFIQRDPASRAPLLCALTLTIPDTSVFDDARGPRFLHVHTLTLQQVQVHSLSLRGLRQYFPNLRNLVIIEVDR